MSEPVHKTEPLTSFESKPTRELSDDEAYVRVMSDFEKAKSEKSVANTRALRYYNIFKALDPPEEVIKESSGKIEDDESLYSNTYLPVGAAIVESGVSKIFNQLFSTSQYMQLEAENFEDGLFASEVSAHLMKRLKEMRFKQKVYAALQQAACFDYCITGTRWLLEDGYVPKPQVTNETVHIKGLALTQRKVQGGSVYVPDKVDRSDMFVLNYFRCYPDWTSEDGFNDSRFFIDTRDEKIESLIANSNIAKPWGRYKNIDKVVDAALKGTETDLGNLDPLNQTDFIKNRRVPITRYWTKDHIIEVSMGYVIRRLDTYDWALQLWTIFQDPNSFGGLGFLQRFERGQLDINASLNARRDLQNLIANPFVVMDQSLVGASDGPVRVFPGKVHVSKGGPAKDKIWVFTPGSDSNFNAMADVQTQIDMAESQAGISANAQAQTSGSRTTATETREIATGTLDRVQGISQLLEVNCLELIYMNMFFLEQTFLTREESFKYNGEHGDRFFVVDSASYMWGSMPRFTAKGVSTLVKDKVEIPQFLQAIQMSLQISQQVPGVVLEWSNIITEMWRKLNPRNYDKFVKDPTAPVSKIPPDAENVLLATGYRVQVSEEDDDGEHLAAHSAIKKTAEYQSWPQALKDNLESHEQAHQQGQSQLPGQTPGQGQIPGQGLQGPADVTRGIRA